MPTKPELRRAALARRQALSPTEVTRRSEQLCAQLFDQFPVAAWRWLHLFLPLHKRHEPDTWPIIRRSWAEWPALQLAAPVVQPDGISLKNYALNPATPLLTNRWGIPEPAADPATEVLPAAFDAVLVPLLAVDQAG
ncbi:5-formyltetrahydrofolate cyclo-ligase, partial [Hymenobacter agri]